MSDTRTRGSRTVPFSDPHTGERPDPRPTAALATLLVAAVLAGCQTPPPPAKPIPPVFPDEFAVLDLTRPLDADVPFRPHQNGFRFERLELEGDADGRAVGVWSALENMGTHVETPAVFGLGDASAANLRSADLVLPLRVIDAPPTRRARDEEGTPIAPTVAVSRLLGHEALHGKIPQGAAVVLRTGLGSRPSGELDMAGRVPDDATPHAGWSTAAIQFLVEQRGVRLVGSDALVLDAAGQEAESPAARAVAEAGVLALVGLADLRAVPSDGAVLVMGVLPVAGARSAPARVLALVPPRRPLPPSGNPAP